MPSMFEKQQGEQCAGRESERTAKGDKDIELRRAQVDGGLPVLLMTAFTLGEVRTLEVCDQKSEVICL